MYANLLALKMTAIINTYGHTLKAEGTEENIGISTLKDDKWTYKANVDKANVLNKYFSIVFTKGNTDSSPNFDGSP